MTGELRQRGTLHDWVGVDGMDKAELLFLFNLKITRNQESTPVRWLESKAWFLSKTFMKSKNYMSLHRFQDMSCGSPKVRRSLAQQLLKLLTFQFKNQPRKPPGLLPSIIYPTIRSRIMDLKATSPAMGWLYLQH